MADTPSVNDEMMFEVTPRLSTLPVLHEAIEKFGKDNDIPEENIYLVNLTLDELLTNYVQYSLGKVSRPRMEVRLQALEGKLIMSFIDSGPPFDPTDRALIDRTRERLGDDVGGAGLLVVRSYADRIAYECVGDRNHLTIEHNLREAQ